MNSWATPANRTTTGTRTLFRSQLPMDRKTKKKLETAGRRIGDARDFLELTDAESAFLDVRISPNLYRTLPMWIFLNDAFLSIVAHTDEPDHLHVRGRVAADIERVFPEADVTETPHADYRYRADVPRAEVARALSQRAETIDYSNFKASVSADEHARHDAYMRVWSIMNDLQTRSAERSR